GIRDDLVTGVQTCALPILVQQGGGAGAQHEPDRGLLAATLRRMIDQRLVLSELESLRTFELERTEVESALIQFRALVGSPDRYRSEERRVGKERRARGRKT